MSTKNNTIVPFNFYGDNLDVVNDNDTLWISVRRVCEALGIDRKTQQRKLQNCHWATGVMMTLVDPNGRYRDAFMIDLYSLPIWLVTISPNKVSDHIHDRLVLYQKEAAKVLANHFFNKASRQIPMTEIKRIANTREASSIYIGHLNQSGIVSHPYLMRYIEHSLALIEGAEPPPGPRLIDVSSFLEGKGINKNIIRRYAPKFGKIVKKLYVEKHGTAPQKAFRFVNGSERLINSYTEHDLPLFEQAFDFMFGEFLEDSSEKKELTSHAPWSSDLCLSC